jgi:hypothetical protein
MMAMSDEHRLRIQTSTTLSTGLIAAAFALIAGVIAALASTADKVPPSGFRILAGASIVPILCLIASILFGGWGMRAAGKVLVRKPPVTELPTRFDEGNFGRQAVLGFLGLLTAFGLALLLGYSINQAKQADLLQLERLRGDVVKLDRALDSVRSRLDTMSAQHPGADVQVAPPTPSRPEATRK